MGDNRIYFTAGLKSYDITRLESRAETWFEWVERSRNLMRRSTFSWKTMELLCFVLQEASKDAGTFVRKWQLKEQYSSFYSSRKYNKFGRLFSIVTFQGDNRAVTIIPVKFWQSGAHLENKGI